MSKYKNLIFKTALHPEIEIFDVKSEEFSTFGRIIEGFSWQEEKQMEVAKTFAGNEGTMGAMGGMMGGMMQNSFSPNPLQQQPSPTTNPIMEKLKQLKDMFDMGLISQEDFDKKKQELLSQM